MSGQARHTRKSRSFSCAWLGGSRESTSLPGPTHVPSPPGFLADAGATPQRHSPTPARASQAQSRGPDESLRAHGRHWLRIFVTAEATSAPCTQPPFRAGAEMAALARQVLGKECPESSMAAVMTTESCREFAARRSRCDGSVRRSLDLLQCHYKPQGLSKQLSRDVVGQGESCCEAVTLNTGASLL